MDALTLPYPPSVSTAWRTPRTGKLAGMTMLSKAQRAYRAAVLTQALVERWKRHPANERLSVQVDVWCPNKGRHDLDNLLKAPLDALTHAHVLADDSQIDHLSIRRMPGIGGMLKVRICVLEAEPVALSLV